MRYVRWLLPALLMLMVLGCEPGETSEANPPPTAAAEPAVGSSPPVTTEPFELRVGPHTVRMPAAELKFVGGETDGLVVLSADSGKPLADGIHAMFFQMNLQLDSDRPWTTGVWRYRLTSGEIETTDGLYLGAPDNHLRPIELDVEVTRSLLEGGQLASRRVQVRLSGRFVSAEAADPLSAPVFEVFGSFEAAADKP